MRLLSVLPLLLVASAATAGPPVYRCEIAGKVSYSDAPCVGAKVVDATPNQGVDKMTGQSRKGKDVQTAEMNTAFDKALQPLTGKPHEEMDVMRRRIKLSAQDQGECTRLDSNLPGLEANAAGATGTTNGRTDVELYQARKRFFDLRC
ncbi:hypothetical protein SRS16CHR_04840 [Variovorax sp. SRS16]|uniref:DUF4124 domain-containing protein n=1 Tax=Variovorax sp. SRS16 TaxID=282217 RepID=UPI001317691B|nr:DUF4124 domain-containing protein [Variovorax sp. SRS16]VTU31244.1 hypothetical protein SRS16CHR_04840 [Variovorax sp. SRS16]